MVKSTDDSPFTREFHDQLVIGILPFRSDCFGSHVHFEDGTGKNLPY
jgi:hypothetical protein